MSDKPNKIAGADAIMNLNSMIAYYAFMTVDGSKPAHLIIIQSSSLNKYKYNLRTLGGDMPSASLDLKLDRT